MELLNFQSFSVFMGWNKPTYFNAQGKTWDTLSERELNQYLSMAASKLEYEKARGRALTWREFADASPRNNDGTFGVLASGVKSITPPVDIIRAGIITASAGYAITSLEGAIAENSANLIPAMSPNYVAPSIAYGNVPVATSALNLSAPAMSENYVAPMIASAPPVTGNSLLTIAKKGVSNLVDYITPSTSDLANMGLSAIGGIGSKTPTAITKQNLTSAPDTQKFNSLFLTLGGFIFFMSIIFLKR